jgi:aspartate aminotransferase
MIPAELEAWARPLERFEAIRREVVRLGDRLCDLSYANAYGGEVEARARAVLQDVLARERRLQLQYSPFGGHSRVRRAVADALRASHHLPFDPGDVVLTPGAAAALHLALRTAAAPGDEVLVPVPCWLDYPLYCAALGLKPVLVPLAHRGFQLDVDAIADAVTPRTAALLLSNPANPTGRSYDRVELESLARALGAAQQAFGKAITWISDETHRDFAPDGAFHSPAAAWPATVIVYSFGKYHFVQGQRAGYATVSPRHPQRVEAARDLLRWVRILGFAAPTALMQWALVELLRLGHDTARIHEWRSRFARELTRAGYEVVAPSATFFLYAGVPEGREDFDFVHGLARAGVLALPAPVFHHRGYFRLSLTGSDEVLERALSILTAPERAPRWHAYA